MWKMEWKRRSVRDSWRGSLRCIRLALGRRLHDRVEAGRAVECRPNARKWRQVDAETNRGLDLGDEKHVGGRHFVPARKSTARACPRVGVHRSFEGAQAARVEVRGPLSLRLGVVRHALENLPVLQGLDAGVDDLYKGPDLCAVVRVGRVETRGGKALVEKLDDRDRLEVHGAVDREAGHVVGRAAFHVRPARLLSAQQVHGNVRVREPFEGKRNPNAMR